MIISMCFFICLKPDFVKHSDKSDIFVIKMNGKLFYIYNDVFKLTKLNAYV